jgi:exodeoxyribonuclease-3
MSLRVVAWNCRRASATHPLWKYFTELSPDLALLQEVSGIPPEILATYDVRTATPPTKEGKLQKFRSALLTRGTIDPAVPLQSPLDWVNREISHFGANLMSYRVTLGGSAMNVITVYAPAWPVARDRLSGHDVSSVKLTQNRDVWVADLLVDALKMRNPGEEWIVGGDFNSCETFDSWKGGPRGNREWLDRMSALGFTECLRSSQGVLTPTFRRPGSIIPSCQIDHLFVTAGLSARLEKCQTGETDRVFGSKLSDHLPIVADFNSTGFATPE